MSRRKAKRPKPLGLPRGASHAAVGSTRIEATLRPFAFSNSPADRKTGDKDLGTFTIDPSLPDDTGVWLYTGRAMPGYLPHLTLGDFRRAKRVLE